MSLSPRWSDVHTGTIAALPAAATGLNPLPSGGADVTTHHAGVLPELNRRASEAAQARGSSKIDVRDVQYAVRLLVNEQRQIRAAARGATAPPPPMAARPYDSR